MSQQAAFFKSPMFAGLITSLSSRLNLRMKIYSNSKFDYGIFYIQSLCKKEMRFSIKDFFSKCHQVRRKLRIWSHLLKKSLMENFIFCAVNAVRLESYKSIKISKHLFNKFSNIVKKKNTPYKKHFIYNLIKISF